MPIYVDEPEKQALNKSNRKSLAMPVPKSFFDKMMAEGSSPFSLGKLVSISANLDTTNDNLLHGATTGAGVTTFNEGIEGDDRGHTFGMSSTLEAEFQKGSLSMEFFTDLYSRLAPQLDGNRYTFVNRETGDVYSENLVKEGISVRFERDINDGYFMVVEGEAAKIDDLSGVALDAQTMWHEQWEANTVIYEPVDHFKKQNMLSASTGLGREIHYKSQQGFELITTYEAGLQVSNHGNVAKAYNSSLETTADRFGADTRIDGIRNVAAYGKVGVEARYAGFDVSVRGMADTNSSQSFGVETGYTFNPKG